MEIRGNKNNQIAGNSNIIDNSTNIYVEGSKTLPQTKMYKLLEIFQNQEFENNTDFPLDLPEEIGKKMEYNCSKIYIKIFRDLSEDYYNLDQILKNDLVESEKVIKQVRIEFSTNYGEEPDEIHESFGDNVLNEIKSRLVKKIYDDPRFKETPFDSEDVEQFVIALLQCCVADCKILYKPSMRDQK